MINRFHVSSFKSFSDGFTFVKNELFISDYSNTTSTVIGKNNAGKTNFIEAFDFLKNIVLRKISTDAIRDVRNLDFPSSEPISFEIDFTTYRQEQELDFIYSIIIDSEKSFVLSETLKLCTPDAEAIIIETQGPTRIFKSVGSDNIIKIGRSKKTIFAHLFSEHPGIDRINLEFFYQKFENSRNFVKTNEFIIFFMSWFTDLKVITPKNNITGSFHPERLNELFDCFDLGVKLRSTIDSDPLIYKMCEDFIKNSRTEEEYRSLEIGTKAKTLSVLDSRTNIMYYIDYIDGKMRIMHFEIFRKGTWAPINSSDLSEGIQRFVYLFSILTEERQGLTFIVDELDRKIHTNLTLKFIELFLQMNRNQQLIFTTHETEVLNSKFVDLDNLWIIDKEEGMGSYLYACPYVRLDRNLRDLYIDEKLI